MTFFVVWLSKDEPCDVLWGMAMLKLALDRTNIPVTIDYSGKTIYHKGSIHGY